MSSEPSFHAAGSGAGVWSAFFIHTRNWLSFWGGYFSVARGWRMPYIACRMSVMPRRWFSMWSRYAYVPIFGSAAALSWYGVASVGGMVAWINASVFSLFALLGHFWFRRIYHLEIQNGHFVLSSLWRRTDVDPGSLVEIKPGSGQPRSLILEFSPPTSFGPQIRIPPHLGAWGFRWSDVERCREAIWAAKEAPRKVESIK